MPFGIRHHQKLAAGLCVPHSYHCNTIYRVNNMFGFYNGLAYLFANNQGSDCEPGEELKDGMKS
jgi:hypothetical protein